MYKLLDDKCISHSRLLYNNFQCSYQGELRIVLLLLIFLRGQSVESKIFHGVNTFSITEFQPQSQRTQGERLLFTHIDLAQQNGNAMDYVFKCNRLLPCLVFKSRWGEVQVRRKNPTKLILLLKPGMLSWLKRIDQTIS